MKTWYRPDDGHVDVPAIPYSNDLWKIALDRSVAERQRPNNVRAERSEELERDFRRMYREDAPFKEYIGFVWKHEDAERIGFVDAPKQMVRVMAQAAGMAGLAVDQFFGPEYGHSLRNEDEANEIRTRRM